MIQYELGEFRPPLNFDGSSVFKYGSTIPVKIQVLDCNGAAVPGLQPHIGWALASVDTPGTGVNETMSTSAADTTGIMRYADSQYIYNFSTKYSGITDYNAKYRFFVWDDSASPQFGFTYVGWGLRLK
jgi:hypothetical protein